MGCATRVRAPYTHKGLPGPGVHGEGTYTCANALCSLLNTLALSFWVATCAAAAINDAYPASEADRQELPTADLRDGSKRALNFVVQFCVGLPDRFERSWVGSGAT